MAAKVVRKRHTNEEDIVLEESTGDGEGWFLDHLIPDTSFATDYVSRKIGGIRDLKVLQYACDNVHNVILAGPTGSAKTSLIYAFAAGAHDAHVVTDDNGERVMVTMLNRKFSKPLVYIPCNGAIEPSQRLGRWVPKPGGGYRFALGLIPQVCIYGGILYFDEVNHVPPKISAVLNGLLDKRRTMVLLDALGSGICANCGYENEGKTEGDLCEGDGCKSIIQSTQYVAADELQIIASYNPDYEGTLALNEAFLNRFAIKVHFPYSNEVEEQMVNSSRLLDVARSLRKAYDNQSIRSPISTNMLIEFEQLVFSLGYGFACENFLNAFHSDERQSVKEIIEANTAEMKREYSDMELGEEDGD